MSEEKKNELESQENKDLSLRISGGEGSTHTPAGFESMDEGDIRIARLGIAQALSQVCTEGKAKMGQLFNNLTGEIFGDEVEIIPLFMFKTRAQFDLERGLVMMSRDNIKVTMAIDEYEQYLDKYVEEVPGSAWEGKEPPKFSMVYNFPCMIVGRLNQFPLSLSMMKTAVKVAKTFLSMARYSGEDMFSRVYKVSSKIEKGTKGTYAVPTISIVRRCTDEEYLLAKQMFDSLYRRKADIDVELTEEKSE